MESKCHKINISIKLWVCYKKKIFEAGITVYYWEWSVFRSGQDFNRGPIMPSKIMLLLYYIKYLHIFYARYLKTII